MKIKTNKMNTLHTYAPVRVAPMVATIVYVDERDEEIDRTNYTDVQKFNKDLMDELQFGVDVAVILYQDENGRFAAHVDDVEYLLHGVYVAEPATMVYI